MRTDKVVVGGGQLLPQFAHAGGDFGPQLGSVLAALQLGKGQLQFLLVQNRVCGHGTGAQHGGQFVAGHTQAGTQLIDFPQVLVQADGGGGGNNDVHHKENEQNNVQNQHGLERHRVGAAGQQRVYDFDHQHAAQPPQKRELRADVAAQVELHVRVVPPADAVDFEQCPAAHQLNGGGQNHADKEDGNGAHAAAAWHRDQADAVHQPHHAEAVNWADRPAEEPAVDELVLFDGGVNDLDAPADAAVQEKPVDGLNDKFTRRHLRPPAVWQELSAPPRSRRCRGLCGQSAP